MESLGSSRKSENERSKSPRIFSNIRGPIYVHTYVQQAIFLGSWKYDIVCVCVRACVRAYMCVCVCVHASLHTCLCMYIHCIYICMYICMYIGVSEHMSIIHLDSLSSCQVCTYHIIHAYIDKHTYLHQHASGMHTCKSGETCMYTCTYIRM